MLEAHGCHVFAGGFSFGVREVFSVPYQLEVHSLGKLTAEANGIKTYVGEWPKPQVSTFLFGNPRCTAFSCCSTLGGDSVRGSWAAPTIDIHQLCEYGVQHGYNVIAWESVQEALSVGRELLDYLRDSLFVPNGYRIAHLRLNAASFGNAQNRKRYFFVAYKDDKNFNIIPPKTPERHTTVGDVLSQFEHIDARPVRFRKNTPYGPDSYMDWNDKIKEQAKLVPQGFDLNRLARERPDLLTRESQVTWEYRLSNMPFSAHAIYRLHKDGYMPVISGSAERFIHPHYNRGLTMRELSALMGWPEGVYPVGDSPIGQIGKGICPEVGAWLAEQVKLYLEDHWGDEDWESSYNHKKGVWEGRVTHGFAEKTFNLTSYCPPKPSRYA